jgi:hypothetical protein
VIGPRGPGAQPRPRAGCGGGAGAERTSAVQLSGATPTDERRDQPAASVPAGWNASIAGTWAVRSVSRRLGGHYRGGRTQERAHRPRGSRIVSGDRLTPCVKPWQAVPREFVRREVRGISPQAGAWHKITDNISLSTADFRNIPQNSRLKSCASGGGASASAAAGSRGVVRIQRPLGTSFATEDRRGRTWARSRLPTAAATSGRAGGLRWIRSRPGRREPRRASSRHARVRSAVPRPGLAERGGYPQASDAFREHG